MSTSNKSYALSNIWHLLREFTIYCTYAQVFVCGRVLESLVYLLTFFFLLTLFWIHLAAWATVNFSEWCKDQMAWMVKETDRINISWKRKRRERGECGKGERKQVTLCSRRSISFCSLLTWIIHWLSSSYTPVGEISDKTGKQQGWRDDRWKVLLHRGYFNTLSPIDFFFFLSEILENSDGLLTGILTFPFM